MPNDAQCYNMKMFLMKFVYIHHATISAADTDYLAIDQPLVFRINGESRICLDVTILADTIRPEYYETFLVQLTTTSNPLFAPQAVVVILDPG